MKDLLDLLGGLVAPTQNTDLTLLLGNVTRMFGASPFFKVIVHSDKNVSVRLIATIHSLSLTHQWRTIILNSCFLLRSIKAHGKVARLISPGDSRRMRGRCRSSLPARMTLEERARGQHVKNAVYPHVTTDSGSDYHSFLHFWADMVDTGGGLLIRCILFVSTNPWLLL